MLDHYAPLFNSDDEDPTAGRADRGGSPIPGLVPGVIRGDFLYLLTISYNPGEPVPGRHVVLPFVLPLLLALVLWRAGPGASFSITQPR